MRIDVVGRNLEVTDAIRQYAESKAGKLPKYFDGVQQITVTLSKKDHHSSGDFDAELVLMWREPAGRNRLGRQAQSGGRRRYVLAAVGAS